MLKRYRSISMGLISALFVVGLFVTSATALEGVAGEVIKTEADLKELEAKGLLSKSQVMGYAEVVRDLGYSITITETTDCSSEAIQSIGFRKATQMNKGKASIGPDGSLQNYAGQGQPFPDIAPNDPQAGSKAAWNYDYKHEGDDRHGEWVYWLTDDKGYVRTLEGKVKKVAFIGRTDLNPKPNLAEKNPSRIRSKEIINFTAPFSSKGLAQLSVKYIDPTRDKDLWVYVPGLRRNARIGGGNRCDCLGGFVHNLDDQTGWDGSNILFNWKSLGLKEMLFPTIRPSDKPFPYAPKAHMIPSSLERRKVWVLEQTPKDPNYCYSKRIMYIDAQSSWFLNSECFDRSGNLWKMVNQYYCLVPNPESVGGGHIVYTNSGTVIDFKIWEAGPYHITGIEVNSGMDASGFTLDAMRRMGK